MNPEINFSDTQLNSLIKDQEINKKASDCELLSTQPAKINPKISVQEIKITEILEIRQNQSKSIMDSRV